MVPRKNSSVRLFKSRSLGAKDRERKAMARLFSLWDPNHTGVITQAAVRDIFGKLSPAPMTPPDYVDALIAYADPTGSGSVKYAEFCEKLFKDYDAAVKITGTV